MKKLYALASAMMIIGVLLFAAEVMAETLRGTAGEDTLIGTPKDDRLSGRGDDDRLSGRRADDIVKGGGGDDKVKGGSGDDKIYPGEGDDEVYGGGGNDLIYARDTDGRDFIDCGPRFDKVETIHRDDVTLSNCERALGPRRGNI
jgi:Ca2+-binding RTX toxin-like protein